MEGPNADFTIQPTSLEIEGPDAREPFELVTFVRIDGVALETAEDFTLTLEGLNNAGRAILDPAVPGLIVIPAIRVVIEDVDSKLLYVYITGGCVHHWLMHLINPKPVTADISTEDCDTDRYNSWRSANCGSPDQSSSLPSQQHQ